MTRGKHKTIPMDPEWKKLLEEKTQSRLRQMPALIPLHDRLLSLGGECVCLPVVEEDLDRLLGRGTVFPGSGALFKKGANCQCHSNSAFLWDANRSLLALMTGYALSEDGVWRQHTWCVFKRRRPARIIETTASRVLYFGYHMTAEESRKFLWSNM